MKRLLLAIVAILLFAPSVASASLLGTDGNTYDGWASKWAEVSRVPLPPFATVSEAECPTGPSPCQIDGVSYIGATERPYAFYHEIGHVVGDDILTDADRDWFQSQMSAPDGYPTNFDERFADLYASCAEHGTFGWMRGNPGVVVYGYGSRYRLLIYRRLCRRIRYYTAGLTWESSPSASARERHRTHGLTRPLPRTSRRLRPRTTSTPPLRP